MSHFNVLVVGENVDEQLQPFWELDLPAEEMATDPRAVFEDCTDEVKRTWETETTKEFWPQSAHVQPSDIDFIKKSVKIGGTTTVKTRYIGKDAKHIQLTFGEENALIREKSDIYGKVISIQSQNDNGYAIVFERISAPKNVPAKQAYASVDQFANDYHGYVKNKDGRYGYWHNPNAKWDWYVIGGRWSGELKIKPGAKGIAVGSPRTLESWGPEFGACMKAHFKDNDSFGFYEKIKDLEDSKVHEYLNKAYGFELYWKHLRPVFERYQAEKIVADMRADVARKADIDVEAMEVPRRRDAKETWDGWHNNGYAKIFAGMVGANFKFDRYPKGLNFPAGMKDWMEENLGFLHSIADIRQLQTMKRDEYVACKSVWAPYALLWDGKWYGKGDMGWWGISANEESQWKGTFKELWAQIPDDAKITVVDCHI